MTRYILERVARIHLAWKRRITRNLAPHGVNPKQVFLLRKLQETGGLAPSAIAELLYADRPTVTSMLGTLERAGWIVRGPDPADGRRSRVELHPRGAAKLASIPQRLWRSGKTDPDPEAVLAPEDREVLLRLLDKLLQGLEDQP
jgi:DNA-binding MarR family transcriptional regulator